MNLFKAFITLFVIAIVCIAILFVDFAYKTFSYSQRTVKADAIVVLAGGKGRVEEGIRLYQEGKGEWLFFIGAGPTVRKSDLYPTKTGVRSPDGVILEKASRNTLENAIISREMIMKKNVRSIILITSRYHMKRASILLRNSLPKDVAIYPFPVDSKNLKEAWWRDGGSFNLLFSEFYKYFVFRAFFLLAPAELKNGLLLGTSAG